MTSLGVAGHPVPTTRDRIGAPTVIEVGSLSPSRFETILSAQEFDDVRTGLQRASRQLSGRRVWNLSSLLNSPAVAAAMGAAAAERVREHFLAPRSLPGYGELLGKLVGASPR